MTTEEGIIAARSIKLFSKYQRKMLFQNGMSSQASPNNIPYAYIVSLKFSGEWLISELYPDDPNKAFGLYMREGKAVLDYLDLNAFDVMMANGHHLFNNLAFSTQYRISVFKNVADQLGQIVVKPRGYEKEFSKAARLS